MASSPDSVSMALFCDFENVALGVRDAKYDKFDIKRVLERLLLKGSIVVKKAYCDWDRYKSFKAAMHEANFELIEIPHVRQSGKNSADIRLVVDALDLCYTKSHVDTFVIISGDSDFSPLVSKLRENAKQVIGVGVKQSTSDLLIANCDEFIFYDDLVRDSQRAAAKREARDNPPPASRRSPEEERQRREEIEALRGKAIDIAVETFEALLAERGESGKIWSSMLKEAIKRRKPDFNESYFGFRAFGNLLEEAQGRGLLELGRDEKSGTYVTRPGPGIALAEPYAAPREARSVEVPERAAEAHAEPGVVAAAEPAARGGRQAGRGARRRAGKAVEAESPAVQAEPAAEVVEPAPQPQPIGHEVAHGEALVAELADSSVANAPAAAAPKSRGGRGRGRGSAVKAEAAPVPSHAVPVPAPEPEAEAEAQRADEVSADSVSTTRAKRGAARSGRKPAQSAGSTAAGATKVAEMKMAEAAEPDKAAPAPVSTEGAAKAGRAAPRGPAPAADAAAPAPAMVDAAEAGSDVAGASAAESRNGEPASARKSAPRARRPRKPKPDAGE